MNSLYDLKKYLESKKIKIKSYNGWQLCVGSDSWTLSLDVLYCNGEVVNKKDIVSRCQQSIKKEKDNVKYQVVETRVWRGIGGGSPRLDSGSS